ncbi:MAG: helix-hairpin-helix domain-containing protein, partial [Planctomycetota bacterium]|nr:helix-hairpin-helix domain-containing protein [Planctomycetota bacterium]
MNSVSMDSVFAEDTDVRDDPAPADTGRQDREQVGRFYPIALNPPRSPTANAQQVDDFYEDGEYWNHANDANSVDDWTKTPPTNTAAPFHRAQWRYRWAADLLDYFTVQGPNEDFFPNVSPRMYPAPLPTPVSNTGGAAGDTTEATPNDANDHAEDAVGVDGLININTASWRVLSMLPMVVVPGTGAIDVPANNELAKAIVYWRDVDADVFQAGNQPHGPFKNLQELNQVEDLRPVAEGGPPAAVPPARLPGFRNAYNTMDPVTNATEPGDEAGDISPAGTDVDGVRHDFEERTLTLNRISNLVTTRSDMFTCYLLVQGWRDAGTANASLVVQRRVAFIVDRSETTPTANPQAKVTYVPNN